MDTAGATGVAEGLHLRADDELRFGGFFDAGHALPVWGEAGLFGVRLHGVGG